MTKSEIMQHTRLLEIFIKDSFVLIIMKFPKNILNSLISCLVLLLVFSAPAISQVSDSNYNWRFSGFDDKGTYFNPQNVINGNNVDTLRQEWMTSLSKASFFIGNETALTTSSVLMINGFIYLIDRSQSLLALNAEDNRMMWYSQLSVFDPNRFGLENQNVHSRSLNYFDKKVWLVDLDCSIKGYNAYNGAIEVDIAPQVLCGQIQQGTKVHQTAFRAVSAPVFYEKNKVLVTSPAGFETVDSSLSYVTGISLESQKIIWKTSLTTNSGDNVKLGNGQWAVDQETGIVYIGTGSPIPEWNASNRPNNNAYSDSVIAIDASTGKIIWSYQVSPNDINGYGCDGNIALDNIGGKKIVHTACRNGYLVSLDAKTGNLLWKFDPPNVKRQNSGNTQKPWLNYPSTDPSMQCPGVFGAVSSNIAVAYGTIYMSTFNSCSIIQVKPVSNIGDTGILNITTHIEPTGSINSTLYAIDSSTGKAKWTQFFDNVALKGGVTVSGGLVYLPSPDGNLYALDASTGSKIWNRSFGTLGLAIPTVIGATARGNLVLAQVIAGTPLLGTAEDIRSGFVFLFTLPTNNTTTIQSNVVNPDNSSTINYAIIGGTIILLIGLSSVYYIRSRKNVK